MHKLSNSNVFANLSSRGFMCARQAGFVTSRKYLRKIQSGKIRLDSWAFLISTELFERANQIAVFIITFTKLRNVLVRWPLRQGVLVPRLDDRFDVAILEGFQKVGYDRLTQEQAKLSEFSCLEAMFL